MADEPNFYKELGNLKKWLKLLNRLKSSCLEQAHGNLDNFAILEKEKFNRILPYYETSSMSRQIWSC